MKIYRLYIAYTIAKTSFINETSFNKEITSITGMNWPLSLQEIEWIKSGIASEWNHSTNWFKVIDIENQIAINGMWLLD